MQFIRENAAFLQQTADLKGIGIRIAELLEIDKQRRDQLQHVEELRRIRNAYSQKIPDLIQNGFRSEAEKAKRQA